MTGTSLTSLLLSPTTFPWWAGRWSSGSSTWSQAFPDSRHSWEGSTPRGAERCALAADAAEQARRAAAHGMDLVYAHPEEVSISEQPLQGAAEHDLMLLRPQPWVLQHLM